jgi:asparagine synthase (glutamine-hydrolysing)
MCGITGVLSRDPVPDLESVLYRMADTLQRRGPDDAGVWASAESAVGLGHRRLAVLDLSPAGHQPMHSACGRFVIAFNGEIYNHLELRRELQAAGHAPQWRGHSDTETLLAAAVAWGLHRALEKAVGMFALALWDGQTHSLHLARDRLGEKPLYYGMVRGRFLFASELKAMRAFPGFDNEIDRDVLDLYLQYCCVPAPYSIYRGIRKLTPGTILTVHRASLDSPAIQPYWRFVDVARAGLARPITDEREAIDRLEQTISDAISAQCISDVPLGAFLSGGIDSSTIVALMQKQSARPVLTFTVGFDEAGFDESHHARAVARHLGTEHHEVRVRPQDAQSVIPLLSELYDEPFADSSQIPTHLICAAARSRVTVALSGDGGDELFGGYNRYFWMRDIWRRFSWMPMPARSVLGSTLQTVPVRAWDYVARVGPGGRGRRMTGAKAHKLGGRLKTVRSPDDLYRSLMTEWPAGLALGAQRRATALDEPGLLAGISEAEQRMMAWDALTYLPDDILTKVDRAAMGVSLETRVPLLDPAVVELAWRLPLGMKIRGGQGKWALRQVLYRHVPRELIERPKAGFAIPVGEWLRGPLREWAEHLLDAHRLEVEGYLSPAPIRAAWEQHLGGRFDLTPRLWSVLMFQAWLEKNA